MKKWNGTSRNLNKSKLKCLNLDSSFFWSDTGTYDSLLKASKFFYNIELETPKKVSCIEEIALENFFIDKLIFFRKCFANFRKKILFFPYFL